MAPATTLPLEAGAKDVQLVERQSAMPAPIQNDATLMFERLARDPSVDVEKLERLIAMQERIMAHQSKAAFDSAFADMQGEIPAIVERARTNNGTYAPLEDIVAGVRPVLQRHGFSLSHETQWPDAKTVRVIGILTHRDGHEKRTEFLSGADASGNKNAIQGLGSAIAYGRRYTTKDLLCIVTKDEDDDGDKAGRTKDAPVAPDGYDAWFATLDGVASEGMRVWSAAWDKSTEANRKHLAATAPRVLAALKTKAANVRAK